MIGLVNCSSNNISSEEIASNPVTNDESSTLPVSYIKEFKRKWAERMPIDELKSMEELGSEDESIKIPNRKKI